MKNKILKTITAVAVISFFVSAAAVDSESWIPLVVCMGSITWVAAFFHVNRDHLERTWI